MSSGISQSYSLTRPNDTSAYLANDVVGASTATGGGVLEFTNIGSGSNSRFFLMSSQFRWDVTSIPSGATSFNLHLYSASPPSAYGDNAPWDLTSQDRPYYLGYISLGTPVDLGSTCYVEANILNKEMRLSGTSLFAYLVTVGAYTPTAQSVQYMNLLGLGLW